MYENSINRHSSALLIPVYVFPFLYYTHQMSITLQPSLGIAESNQLSFTIHALSQTNGYSFPYSLSYYLRNLNVIQSGFNVDIVVKLNKTTCMALYSLQWPRLPLVGRRLLAIVDTYSVYSHISLRRMSRQSFYACTHHPHNKHLFGAFPNSNYYSTPF